MEDSDYQKKSDQIRQLAALPVDKLSSHLADIHPALDTAAPNLAPHIHSIAANAIQFLNSRLPSVGNELPQDKYIQPSRAQKKKWLDMHEAISNPLSVLDHAQNGTLHNDHILALKSVFPDLHQEIVGKLGEHLGDLKSKGKELPYSKRQSIGLLMGNPIDSTMTPASMQAIMSSSNSVSQQQLAQGKQKKASGVELKQINKVNEMYSTRDQSRQLDRRS